jgi:hypothetical protein
MDLPHHGYELVCATSGGAEALTSESADGICDSQDGSQSGTDSGDLFQAFLDAQFAENKHSQNDFESPGPSGLAFPSSAVSIDALEDDEEEKNHVS